jgi:ABC-type transporter Mla MlaB component
VVADDAFLVREIVLPRSFDIATVRTVATEIQDAIVLGELTLDATEIAKVDAAGLQVLCAAIAAARTTGARVDWKGVPAALIEGARTLALVDALGLQEKR